MEEGDVAVADPLVDVEEYLKRVDKVVTVKVITFIFFGASFNLRFDQPVDGLAFGIRHKKSPDGILRSGFRGKGN